MSGSSAHLRTGRRQVAPFAANGSHQPRAAGTVIYTQEGRDLEQQGSPFLAPSSL